MRQSVFVGVLVALFASSVVARAEEPAVAPAAATAPVSSPAADDGVRKYAASRLREGVGLAVAGAASMAGGGVALAADGTFDHALGVPLLAGGALELGLGTEILLASPGWEDSASSAPDAGGDGYREAEIRRIEAFRARARVTEALEAGVVAGGVLTSYFAAGNDVARGVGLGVAVDAAVLLAADVMSGFRAEGYASALRGTTFAMTPDRRGGVVAVSRAF